MALRETYLQLVITCVVSYPVSSSPSSAAVCSQSQRRRLDFVLFLFFILFCCFATIMRLMLDCLRWMWFHRNYIIIVLTPLAVIALPIACPSSVSVCYFASVCGSGGNRLFHYVCLGSNFTVGVFPDSCLHVRVCSLTQYLSQRYISEVFLTLSTPGEHLHINLECAAADCAWHALISQCTRKPTSTDQLKWQVNWLQF